MSKKIKFRIKMQIKLNGKAYETGASDLEGLKREVKFSGEIAVINGYASTQNCEIKAGDELFLLARGAKLAPQELRELMFARNAPAVNEALQGSRVAICGLGGLGSNVAILLARAGVGELFLIDFDVVEPTNLNRQQYEIGDLYKPKTAALREKIARINPFVRVRTLNERLTAQNVAEILKNERIICECFDDAAAKAMIFGAFGGTDCFLICASGMAGSGDANEIRTTRLGKNVFVCGDRKSAAAQGVGLLAPRVAICAAHQANVALRLILGEEA